MKIAVKFFVLALLVSGCWGQTPVPKPVRPRPVICAACVRANLEYLASDEMRGRESATEDEHKAAIYIGSKLRAYGIRPAGDAGGYVQKAPVLRYKATGPPVIKVSAGADAAPKTFTYGPDFYALYSAQVKFSGPLKKINSEEPLPQIAPGTVVLISGSNDEKRRDVAFSLFSTGAAAVLLPESSHRREQFEQGGRKLPTFSPQLEGQNQTELGASFNILAFNQQAIDWLTQAPEGTQVEFDAPVSIENGHTWNAVGMLRGTDPALRHAAVLFTAHLDHLGIGTPVHGDKIYNGADDDASGVVAVLELARMIGTGARPKRTVIFALFGSEELGGLGSTYFREHSPIPLQDIAANLEFEMIGRADSAVRADTLWLTGWERSNLGPTLAKHGANLVGDPHPDEDFFTRSDNYVLAKKGVVAQTVSSYGLHKDYHKPSDDLAHIDFKHMDAAIGSLLGPVKWLVNSDFRPEWNEGGRP